MKKLILFLLSESFAKIIPIIAVPLYLEIAGLAGYGEMSLFSAITSLLIPLVSLSYNNIVIKSIHKNEKIDDEVNNFIKILLINSSILIAFILLIMFFFELNNAYYYIFLIIQSLFCALFLLMKDFFIHIERRQVYSLLVFSHVIMVHLFNLGMIYLLDVNSDFWLYRFYSELIVIFVCLILGFILLKDRFNILNSRLNLKINKFEKNNLKLGLSFLPRNCLIWYRTVVERKYVLFFLDEVALGIYTIIHQLSVALTFPFVLYANYNGKKNIALVKNNLFSLKKFFLWLSIGFSILIIFFIMFQDLLIVVLPILPDNLNEFVPIYFLALSLSIISNYLLSLKVHSASSESSHNAVFILYLALPIFLFLLNPDTLYGVGFSVAILNSLYLIYAIREFLK